MKKLTFNQLIFIIIGFFAFTGLAASLLLTVEKIQILENKELAVNCAINNAINCTSVMESWQAELLGTPNSIFGIAGYGVVLGIAITSFIKMNKSKVFWGIFDLGAFGAFVFSYWLYYQSIYVINSLCPFCLISLVSATFIFVASKLVLLKEDLLPFMPKVNWKEKGGMIVSLAIAALIVWFVFNFALAYGVFGSSIFS